MRRIASVQRGVRAKKERNDRKKKAQKKNRGNLGFEPTAGSKERKKETRHGQGPMGSKPLCTLALRRKVESFYFLVLLYA